MPRGIALWAIYLLRRTSLTVGSRQQPRQTPVCTARFDAPTGATVIIIRQHLTALDGREYAAFEVLGSGIYANENEVLRTASAMSDMPHRGVDHSPWSR